jgi:hypothetical protein
MGWLVFFLSLCFVLGLQGQFVSVQEGNYETAEFALAAPPPGTRATARRSINAKGSGHYFRI